MILVILGTQDKPFDRLLKAVEREIKNNNIKDEVIVQAGATKYKSDNMKIFDYISINKFKKLNKESNLIITHGGVGSIIDSLKNEKKVIAVPRQAKYLEHVNDHQVEIVDEFAKAGYILECKNLNNLSKTLEKVKTFEPKKYTSNNSNMIKLIEDYIDNI